MTLPPIPILNVPGTEEPAVVSAQAYPERLAVLLIQGRSTYTQIGFRLAEARSRTLAARLTSPYAAAVTKVDRAIAQPGAYLLNYSYEWGCTAGASPDPTLGGTTLHRTLDWPFDGLGRALIVVRHQSAQGAYLSVTWPGFAGVLTGLAPGRFAAAINQPPLPYPALGRAGGWLANRWRVSRSRAIPPAHLLRLAFDTCATFQEAAALIRDTPLCLPAIFTLAGPNASEAIVIERTQSAAFHPAHPVAANHWASVPGPKGTPRNPSSPDRHAAMTGLVQETPKWSLDWVRPPILNLDTRLAVMANLRTGRLLVRGWEKTGAVTAVLDVTAEL